MVTNQPDPTPAPISYAYSRAKYFFLLKQLKILTVTDLVEIFKSGTLSRKISISERLGSGMNLRNRNEPKNEQENNNLYK